MSEDVSFQDSATTTSPDSSGERFSGASMLPVQEEHLTTLTQREFPSIDPLTKPDRGICRRPLLNK